MSDAAAPKKSKKVLVIALVGLVLAAGGGGGAWFMLNKKGGDEEKHATKKHEAKPIFVTLDPFTVNLMDPRGERFAQIGVTLQIEDVALEMKIKDRLPAVRNDILLLIASKQIEELLSVEGKNKLAQDIRVRTARSLGFEVEEAEEPKPAKAKAEHKEGEADEAEAKPAAKPKKRRKKADDEENPIQQVLFSQFIVQ